MKRTAFVLFLKPDPRTGKMRRSTYRMPIDELPRGAEAIPGTEEWRDLPESPAEYQCTGAPINNRPTPPPHIVIVTGGRDYHDRARVFAALDRAHNKKRINLLLHGGARGADSLAAQWAMTRNVAAKVFEADWEKHGPRAGPLRNQQMVDFGAGGCIAFPGGAGTADCTRRCQEAGIPVWRPFG